MTRRDADDGGRELDVRQGDAPGHIVVQVPRPSRAGLLVRTLLAAAAVVVILTIGLPLLVGKSISTFFDYLNPFDSQTVDRSQPTLLVSIKDLERFTAAEGNFEKVIDLEQNRRFLPDDRTLFVAAGSVDAYVDFASLDDGAVVTDPSEPGSVTITLPTPRLDEADLDLDNSYVYSDGTVLGKLTDRFTGDSTDQAELYRRARDEISAAATETDLVDRAESNTRSTLTGLLGALGYTDITVEFEPDPT